MTLKMVKWNAITNLREVEKSVIETGQDVYVDIDVEPAEFFAEDELKTFLKSQLKKLKSLRFAIKIFKIFETSFC